MRDRVEIDTFNLGGDFVIVRADGTPALPLHGRRGRHGDADQPRHPARTTSRTRQAILPVRGAGHPLPVFAHLPLILNPDGTKMSKRKSQTAVADYIAQGFTREALVNYFAFLGWSPGTEEDVLSLDEITDRFELDKVQKGGARFDRERLEWLNGQWIRRLDDDDLVDRLLPFLEAARVAGQVDRVPTPTSCAPCCRSSASGSRPSPRSSTWRASCATSSPRPCGARAQALGRGDDARRPRSRARGLAAHDEVTWEADELEPPLRTLVERLEGRRLFMAIRVATTGQTATPPLFDTLVALGRDRTLARIDAAIARSEAA